jgi:hypothetical protein
VISVKNCVRKEWTQLASSFVLCYMTAFVAVNSEVYEDKSDKDKSQRKWGERMGGGGVSNAEIF